MHNFKEIKKTISLIWIMAIAISMLGILMILGSYIVALKQRIALEKELNAWNIKIEKEMNYINNK